jgi:hypothetical protein
MPPNPDPPKWRPFSVTDDEHTIKYDEPAVAFQAELLMQTIADHFTSWVANSIVADVPPTVRVAAATYVFATMIAVLADYTVPLEINEQFVDLVCKNIARAAKEAKAPEVPNERPN